MKKSVFAFIALVSMGSVLQATQYEYDGYRYEVMPILSKQVSQADSALDDSKIFYGIRALVHANDIVSLQIGYERSDNATMGDGGKSDVVRGVTNLLLDLPNRSKVTPYAILGLGYEKLYRAYAGTSSQVFLNGGAGVKYALSDRVDLVAEGRIIQKIEDKDTDAILGAGLSFKYGDKRASSSSSLFTDSRNNMDNIDAKSSAISVKELANLTPVKKPIKQIEQVEVVSDIKNGDVIEEVVIEDISGTSDVEVSGVDTKSTPNMIHEEVIVEEDISSLEPVEFVGEPVYDDISASDILEEDFSTAGYYVQMEAAFNDPTVNLLDKLDARGYSYILQPSLRQGRNITLVLVGPYASRADAKRDLRKLKKIRKDAFIYKLK